ncbi:hypothetical protein FHL15_003678 [Xylaria flabelliformis]|uniref:Uncharacterized protein n=1 Tax=Xylaria flabelliformis TaxID=2512241 RepID=A0A553I575_9PEZI|nr:hypothetical protein FHL15_003678 [Xylaria flabelliformis]
METGHQYNIRPTFVKGQQRTSKNNSFGNAPTSHLQNASYGIPSKPGVSSPSEQERYLRERDLVATGRTMRTVPVARIVKPLLLVKIIMICADN